MKNFTKSIQVYADWKGFSKPHLIRVLNVQLIRGKSETDNSQDFDLVKEVAEYFHIKYFKANQIIREVVKSVKAWHKEATQLKISKKEQDYMASAFRIVS